jgi:hypothetical protein
MDHELVLRFWRPRPNATAQVIARCVGCGWESEPWQPDRPDHVAHLEAIKAQYRAHADTQSDQA